MTAATFVGTLNFGAIGSTGNEATITVTGLTGITASSYVEAWLRHEATAEHSLDELKYDPVTIYADENTIVAGTSVTIVGIMPHGHAYGTYKVNGIHS